MSEFFSQDQGRVRPTGMAGHGNGPFYPVQGINPILQSGASGKAGSLKDLNRSKRLEELRRF